MAEQKKVLSLDPGGSVDPMSPMANDPNAQPLNLYTEYGVTGLRHWAGRVDEEWLTQLASQEKRYKIFREMRDNDPIIGAILFAIEMLIRQAEWFVEPANNTPEAVVQATFLEECLNDMSTSWSNTVAEILTMIPFGFSPHEIVYKKRMGQQAANPGNPNALPSSKYNDGKIGWRKMPIRAQETVEEWLFDNNGGVQGFIQNAPPKYDRRKILIEKMLLFRTGVHKGNPEGRSLLRNAFRPWFFKKRIEEVEGIGIERDLAGLPVIYAPSRIMLQNASPADRAVFTELKKIIRNIRRDEQEGVIMPGDRDDKGELKYELKLLSTGGQRQFNTTEVINRYDQRISVTVLADFILLGAAKVGSFALSSNKTELFGVALGTILDEIAEVMNAHAVPRLFKYNGESTDHLPKLAHGDVETPDLKELGDFIQKLAGAGMPLFPDEELENRLRLLAKMPARDYPEPDGSLYGEGSPRGVVELPNEGLGDPIQDEGQDSLLPNNQTGQV